LLWGVPVVLVLGAGIAYGESVISLTARGVVWVVAVVWAGTGCLINGRSCGRVHCRIEDMIEADRFQKKRKEGNCCQIGQFEVAQSKPKVERVVDAPVGT